MCPLAISAGQEREESLYLICMLQIVWNSEAQGQFLPHTVMWKWKPKRTWKDAWSLQAQSLYDGALQLEAEVTRKRKYSMIIQLSDQTNGN